MEEKRVHVLRILEKLNPTRNMAEGFITLVKDSDEDFLDEVIHLLFRSMKKAKVLLHTKHQTSIKERLKKVKELERSEAEQENIDDILEDM